MSQSSFVITLSQIVNDYGMDILKDGKRVIATFSDYCPNAQAEKNKLRIAYEFDVIGQLTRVPPDSLSISIACNKAIDMLKEKAFIEENIATSIVCDIADVLKLKYDLTLQTNTGINSATAIRSEKQYEPQSNTSVPQKQLESQRKTKTTMQNTAELIEAKAKNNNEIVLHTLTLGSGIGYSTHDNPISPMQAYEDLESQFALEMSLIYKIIHPLKLLFQQIRLNKKYKIACEWDRAQVYCNIYDAYLIDGAGHTPAALKFKKYNEQYFKKLECKFWS